MPDKAAVFIDGGYLDHVLNFFHRPSIDYQKFSDELCRRSGGFARFRTYYYHCAPHQGDPPTPDEVQRYSAWTRFYTALQHRERFQVRLGKLERRSCPNCGDTRFREKRVDSELAVDLVRLSAKNAIDKAILVAGDSDHAPAVRTAKEDSVLVAVWHLPRYERTVAHGELLRLCDERFAIPDELIQAATRT
jgi:uncharacterized LabA/DUF88 family protein